MRHLMVKKAKPSSSRELIPSTLLREPIEHIDITAVDTRPLIDRYKHMRGSAGDIAVAVDIYNRMLADPGCTIILTLAGSSSAQGLMDAWPALVKHNMVDVVITTGASVIDMDLFEALGFRHFKGSPDISDKVLGDAGIDRIYDTFIREKDLQCVDSFCRSFVNGLRPGHYTPRQILASIGARLSDQRESPAQKRGSLLQRCYEHQVPVFSIGLTDSAFGMGSVYHQLDRALLNKPNKPAVTLDTTSEYLELAKIKLASPTTGLFMIGGGVPKNHAQDTVITAQGILAQLRGSRRNISLLKQMGYDIDERKDEVPLHKYAVQITVADPRDGGCSSSTLSEARSWGKVSLDDQVMVFGEATGITPLILSAVYHEGIWRTRTPRDYLSFLSGLKPAQFRLKSF